MSRLILAVIIVASFATGAILSGRVPEGVDLSGGPEADNPARRLVSLAPSITEVLFALGLGDRVVGVTHYCDHPEEAKTKYSVGGYYTPNYEAILKARPDLVVTLPEHDLVRERLRNLGVNVLRIDHRSVSGILEGIEELGRVCAIEPEARMLLEGLRSRMDAIGATVGPSPRPRVLISIGRRVHDGTVSRITVCGPGSFFNDLIRLAGGRNAYTGLAPYPRVSAEGILAIDPDVIVDLVPDMVDRGWSATVLRAEWESLPGLSAVRNQRVVVLGGDHLTVPGPRFILLLEELARAIHPEAAWERK